MLSLYFTNITQRRTFPQTPSRLRRPPFVGFADIFSPDGGITFTNHLVNGIKQPDGTIISLTPRQVGDLLGHSTSQITEMYYVKRDNSRLVGITDSFEI